MKKTRTDAAPDPGPYVPSVAETTAARPRLGPTPGDVSRKFKELVAACDSRNRPRLDLLLAEIAGLAARRSVPSGPGTGSGRPARRSAGGTDDGHAEGEDLRAAWISGLGTARLTEREVLELRAMARTGRWRLGELAAIIGVTPLQVIRILGRRAWVHVRDPDGNEPISLRAIRRERTASPCRSTT